MEVQREVRKYNRRDGSIQLYLKGSSEGSTKLSMEVQKEVLKYSMVWQVCILV